MVNSGFPTYWYLREGGRESSDRILRRFVEFTSFFKQVWIKADVISEVVMRGDGFSTSGRGG